LAVAVLATAVPTLAAVAVAATAALLLLVVMVVVLLLLVLLVLLLVLMVLLMVPTAPPEWSFLCGTSMTRRRRRCTWSPIGTSTRRSRGSWTSSCSSLGIS
jgi:hypothetical protein